MENEDNNTNNKLINTDYTPISPTEEDIPAIKELCYYFWEEEGIFSENFYEEILSQNLSYIYKDNSILIAVCLALYEDNLKQVNISVLCVHNEYQRRGIGKSILNACIDNCVEKGYNEFNLNVCVTNHNAIKLYKKVGFIYKKLCKNYYSEDEPPNNDAYFMELIKKKKEENEEKEYQIINVKNDKENKEKKEDNYKLYIDKENNDNISLCKWISLIIILIIGIIIGTGCIIIFTN